MRKDYFKFFMAFSLLTTCLINSIRVVYMLSYGISEGEITLLKGIFSIIVAAVEIPTGIVADKFSKKKSLQIGCILFALHSLFYVLMPNFTGFLLTQILLAFSSAFTSGADDGYLDDYINKYSEDTFIDIAGKIEYYSSFIKAALYLVSGYLFLVNPHINFILTFILGILSFGAICLLPEVKNKNVEAGTGKLILLEYARDTLNVVKYIFKTKIVFHVTVLSAIIVSSLIFNFELYQVMLSKFNISMQYYGYLYASFMILGGAGARLSKKLLENYGEKRLFIITIFSVAISYLLMGISNIIVLILVAIILQQVSFGGVGLAVRHILMNNLFSQDTKSTLISVYSLLTSFLKGAIVIVFGQVLSIVGNKYTYLVMAFIMLLCIIYSGVAISHEKMSK